MSSFSFFKANYINWRIVNDRAADTNQQMIDLQFAFIRAQFGIAEPSLR